MMLAMKGVRVASHGIMSYLSTVSENLVEPLESVDVCAKYIKVTTTTSTNASESLHMNKVLPKVNYFKGGVLKKHSKWTNGGQSRPSVRNVVKQVSWCDTGDVKEFAKRRVPMVVTRIPSKLFSIGRDKLVHDKRISDRPTRQAQKRLVNSNPKLPSAMQYTSILGRWNIKTRRSLFLDIIVLQIHHLLK